VLPKLTNLKGIMVEAEQMPISNLKEAIGFVRKNFEQRR
jgi:hypothetical protein